MEKSPNLPSHKDQKKNEQDDRKQEWGQRGFEQGTGQGSSESNYDAREELPSKKGYEEDQPGHPVRSTGSTREDQESGSIQPGDDREGKN